MVLGAAALVFALAVGVILGSGPLRTALLGHSADEADGLRTQLAARDSDLVAANTANELLERHIEEIMPFTTEGRLADVNLALVIAPGVSTEQAERMASAVSASGATVVATATLSEAWLDVEQLAFRSALAEEIIADVGVATEQTAPEAVLHAALAQVLVPSLAGSPDSQGLDNELPPDTTLPQEQAGVLLDVLTRAGLLHLDRAPASETAVVAEPTVVLVLTPESDEGDASYADDSAALARLATALANSDLRTVIAQGARTESDPFAVAEQTSSATGTFAVVSNAWGPAGPILVILAAADDRSSGDRFYGDPERERLVPAS